VLLASRGFGLTDRPSTLFGGLGRPPIEFYHEIDRKPGYYGGLSWKHHDWLEVRALRYDNRADPGAETDAGGYAWRTRFYSLGASVEPSEHWTLIAQYLNGNTAVGPDGNQQFYMRFHADFALASYEWARERFTVRYDNFDTNQVSGFFFGPPSDETGHSWTFAWSHQHGEHWQFVAEWLRVASVFPPRIALAESAAQVESQFQLAARYRFRLAW
jgi:hypothetical protein